MKKIIVLTIFFLFFCFNIYASEFTLVELQKAFDKQKFDLTEIQKLELENQYFVFLGDFIEVKAKKYGDIYLSDIIISDKLLKSPIDRYYISHYIRNTFIKDIKILDPKTCSMKTFIDMYEQQVVLVPNDYIINNIEKVLKVLDCLISKNYYNYIGKYPEGYDVICYSDWVSKDQVLDLLDKHTNSYNIINIKMKTLSP